MAHFFPFSAQSASRRMASDRGTLAFDAHASMASSCSASRRTVTVLSPSTGLPIDGR
jgi:hypothetical protein